MRSIFDREKLRQLLRDFYVISRIRITVFDEHRTELASYPERVADHCAVIRGTPGGLAACMACDRQACAEAAEKRRTHVYTCHAGFTEAVTPLYVGEVPVGYLLFGHAFSYPSHADGWAAVRQRCAPLGVDEARLREAVFRAPLIEEDYVRSAARILHAVASYLILERMATLKEDLLATRLEAYLADHFTEKLSAERVCAALGVGKTQLYALSRQLYGCGVAERVRALRMARAKELLLGGELPLAEVAARCGYADYNYFITVFSREEGLSPGAFRKRGKGAPRAGR